MFIPLHKKFPPGERTPFERLGGEAGVARIIDDFVDRVTNDVMIGFFFSRVKKDRLKILETQFAAAHLGGPVAYEGRPVRAAHAAHPIMGGHFNRRLTILDLTLRAHGVSDDIRSLWLQHNEELRSHITGDGKEECIARPANLEQIPGATGASNTKSGEEPA